MQVDLFFIWLLIIVKPSLGVDRAECSSWVHFLCLYAGGGGTDASETSYS